MKITIFGVGYVGLVQAAVFADTGHHVVCVDVDDERIENLKKGIIPIYEPGLSTLVEENYAAGRLEFTTDAEVGVAHGDIQFIAVGTPSDEDGTADLTAVLMVAQTIATHMTTSKIIVDKSTVPVGTAGKVKVSVSHILEQRGVDIDFDIVSNPEFLKEGSAIEDCKRPDRIIIGTNNTATASTMRELYAPMNRNHERIIIMDVKSAELTKYAANAMLATKISFMNEISNLAEALGADIEAVRQGIGSDKRVGYHFIYPGCGYGGSCFPKDVQALVRTAESVGYDAEILKSVEAVNVRQKNKLFEKINKHFGNDLKGKVFALWGLSFKPNTDDMRDAPSRALMEALWAAGAKVQAYDPEAMTECERIYGQREDLILMGSQEGVLEAADALIIVTEWQHFKVLDFEVLKLNLKQPVIFDGRNLFEPQKMRDNGITYYSIGRA
ncbi:MAG: UDP-glucose/GDP-mannose dehydrogenase family protein [Xanthomonadales bacterium]|nr:UDP-glucose/GDP-mannose dehydrogenase family protein [Xanthomonadales bacterium]